MTSPQPSANVAGKVWTAMVPDEPYRAKGLCREGNFPLTPCTFIVVPTAHPPQQVDSSLQFWGYLCKIDLTRLLQPCKLGFHYGGSSILLDNLDNLN